jgi:hypothetical protein
VVGPSLPVKRRDARWCTRSCESKARRQAARKAAFEAANPDAAELLRAESQSLAELHQRTGRSAHWDDIEAGRAGDDLANEIELEDQDDEVGIVAGDRAPDPWEARDQAFAAQTALAEEIDAINDDFNRRARPFLEQQRRNAGVIRPELAALTRARDSKISALTRTHQRAQALEWAAQDQPGRLVSAHERAVEHAAARSFATDHGRGRFLRDDPGQAGRDTMDIAVW